MALFSGINGSHFGSLDDERFQFLTGDMESGNCAAKYPAKRLNAAKSQTRH